MIPGLSEKRPSVLPGQFIFRWNSFLIILGDIIYAWVPGTTDVEYEGQVFRVEHDALLVNFCADFHTRYALFLFGIVDLDRFGQDQRFNIRFAFSRLPLRLMHRAVDQVEMEIIWPSRGLFHFFCEAVLYIDHRFASLISSSLP